MLQIEEWTQTAPWKKTQNLIHDGPSERVFPVVGVADALRVPDG